MESVMSSVRCCVSCGRLDLVFVASFVALAVRGGPHGNMSDSGWEIVPGEKVVAPLEEEWLLIGLWCYSPTNYCAAYCLWVQYGYECWEGFLFLIQKQSKNTQQQQRNRTAQKYQVKKNGSSINFLSDGVTIRLCRRIHASSVIIGESNPNPSSNKHLSHRTCQEHQQ